MLEGLSDGMMTKISPGFGLIRVLKLSPDSNHLENCSNLRVLFPIFSYERFSNQHITLFIGSDEPSNKKSLQNCQNGLA